MLASWGAQKWNVCKEKQRDRILQRYHLLAQNTQEAIWFLRMSDRRFVDVNAAACRRYGYTREEFRRLTLDDVRVASIPDEFTAADLRSAAFESLHRRKDGSTFPVWVHSEEALLEGEVVHVDVVRDLTELDRRRPAR